MYSLFALIKEFCNYFCAVFKFWLRYYRKLNGFIQGGRNDFSAVLFQAGEEGIVKINFLVFREFCTSYKSSLLVTER